MDWIRRLRLVRLTLGGALLGVAITGIVASMFGVDGHKHTVDLAGALLGGTGVAVFLKLAHVA